MQIPVRCMTCGAVIADKWEQFQKLVNSGKTVAQALDELKIQRYCCRRMFLTHIDFVDEIITHKK